MNCAFSRSTRGIAERLQEEFAILLRRHLGGFQSGSGGLGPPAPDRRSDEHAWRRTKDRSRKRPIHQPAKINGASRVPAKQPVISKQPQVPRPRNRMKRRLGHDVFGRRSRFGATCDEEFDLGDLEPRERDVEPLDRQKVDQFAELDRKQLAIPARLFGQSVVNLDGKAATIRMAILAVAAR